MQFKPPFDNIAMFNDAEYKCGNCQYFLVGDNGQSMIPRELQNGVQGACILSPPQTFVVARPKTGEPIPLGLFPVLHKDRKCGQFYPKEYKIEDTQIKIVPVAS